MRQGDPILRGLKRLFEVEATERDRVESWRPSKASVEKVFMALLHHRGGWLLASLLVQLALAPFLAHGYDLRVSIVAARNIVSNNSPYRGGPAPIGLEEGYGADVQGIGETPLWTLWLGAAYLLSKGDYWVFNLLSKLPMVATNLVLAYLASGVGGRSWFRFFLFNPFLLLASVAWGKPDNIAALAAAAALLALNRPSVSAGLTALSLMFKPIALPIIPPMLAYYSTRGMKTTSIYLFSLASAGATLFFSPFLVLGWPLAEPVQGIGNWFKPAGGLSVFNALELFYDLPYLPMWMEPLGLLPAVAMSLALAYCLVRPPKTLSSTAKYSLAASAVFFSTRTWVSEQNLILLFPLFMLAGARSAGRWLWVAPLFFMLVNTSLFQLLYPLYPAVNNLLAQFDVRWRGLRLAARFLLNIPWLYCLFSGVKQTARGSEGGRK